jgi:D-alanine-D-alanine ligase
MKKKIAIIYGGYSSEVKISKKSADTIYSNIDSNLFEPYLVEITKKSWYVHIRGGVAPVDKNKFTYILNDSQNSFDLAFITIHGTPGEDGKLQAYFDVIDLPYVNSGVLASSLTFNKWACNSFLRDFGISTAKAILLRNSSTISPIQIADELGFPCFVKPNDGGSSFGISKVKTLMEMPDAIAKAFTEGDEVVIESFIEGREITSGIYNNGTEIITLPVTEIITDNDFFDYEAKYKGESNEITPAEISIELTKEIQAISKKIYKRLDLNSLSRIDYIVTREDEIYLIEVNTNPGMSDESIVPQQIEAAGFNLTTVLTQIINTTSLK